MGWEQRVNQAMRQTYHQREEERRRAYKPPVYAKPEPKPKPRYRRALVGILVLFGLVALLAVLFR